VSNPAKPQVNLVGADRIQVTSTDALVQVVGEDRGVVVSRVSPPALRVYEPGQEVLDLRR
jgi:hypothetical protein